MTGAAQVLRDRLAGGPIGFDEFMDLALYDPDVGFYATTGRAGGRRGDFLTSPETGPLFGVLVGRSLDRVWRQLGEPADFTFVDAGAGPGTLARTVLAAQPDCVDVLRIVCVESSAAQRDLHPEGVDSRADLPEGPIIGVIFANELLDNVPFRVAEHLDGEWGELAVMQSDAGPRFLRIDLDDAGRRLAELLLPEPKSGDRIPLAERATSFVDEALGRLARGRLVIVDYGASTAELAARGMTGWLRTYRGHDRGSDPFADVGQRDITGDVPFDQLPHSTRQRSQAEWLADLDIEGLVDEGRHLWAERAAVGNLEALKARSRISEAEALTDTDGLGGFRVCEWEA